ncbi:DUF5777 family beta-barrel protein [Acidobacteria bacterium AH-259-G07]|nr:DUF5777 family beta-barrel protein [Acidobacteria bacterium AH-259-G07]
MNLRRSLLFSSLSVWPLSVCLLAYSGGPLPRLTGGFQEQTCHSCHNSFPLNEGRTRGGLFYVSGVPKVYKEGSSYPITVVIGQPGQVRWGFELSIRFASSGSQAGQLVPVDEMTQVKEEAGIQYIAHTARGTRKGTVNGPVEFHFNWIAPDSSGGSVLFNAAGNAANCSGDPTGNYIYTAGAYSGVTGVKPPVATAAQADRKVTRRLNSSRFMHLPAPVDLRKGDREIHIEHRFLEPILDAGPGDAFGIDAGANINLGLNYALTDDLTVGVSRARFDQVTVFTGTYEIHHDQNSFWKMSLLGGLEAQENFLRHYSPFIQLATSLDYKRLRTYVVPTLILNSRNDEDLKVFRSTMVNPDDNNTFSLGLGADIALHPRFSLAGEYVPRLAGFGGLGNERSTLSWGVKIRTFGHVFTILLSNTRNFTPAKYGVNAETTDFALGFNIYRRR